MMRYFLIMVFCAALAACGGSGGESPAGAGPGVAGSTGGSADPGAFDPTAMTLDAPPTDGKLPAELIPPV